ncbi:MAG: response regulator [Flavobacteriales bacterium]|nr:response regulator [Flavobacteriales bacterium]
MKHIRTIIVDDEPAACARLAKLLAMDPEVEVVGEARNGQEAVDAVNKFRPDLLFLDVQMPQMNGLEAVGKIRGPPALRRFRHRARSVCAESLRCERRGLPAEAL